MKKLYTIIIFALGNINVCAQAPNWAWAKSEGSYGEDVGQSITKDVYGNIYVTGAFSSSSITFGTTTLINVDFTGNSTDIYIVKYDALGNVLWARGGGGNGQDVGNSVTTDASGNVYITGEYDSPSIILGADTLINVGDNDIFIVKYDAFGNLVWAKGTGGTLGEECNSISADSFGNVFITGSYYNSISFESITLANAGGMDMFITKYDALGNVLWAKNAGGIGLDRGSSTATDVYGNVYVLGTYYNSSSIVFGAITLTNAGIRDIFIVKYDASGNVIWAKGEGGSEEDSGSSIATDATGNVYVTGYYYSPTISFGTITITHSIFSSANVFVVKYDSSGNALWAKVSGSSGSASGLSVNTDAFNNVYVTGYFNYSVNFGSDTLTSIGIYDIFMVKYDSSGNAIWAQGIGGAQWEWGNAITSDAYGNVYVTGKFSSNTISFDTFTLNNSGGWDMFIAKLNATTVGIEEKKAGNELLIYPNPATDLITIQTNQPILIEIYSLEGNLIESKKIIGTNNHTISNYANGMYLVKFYDNTGGFSYQKLVKQ